MVPAGPLFSSFWWANDGQAHYPSTSRKQNFQHFYSSVHNYLLFRDSRLILLSVVIIKGKQTCCKNGHETPIRHLFTLQLHSVNSAFKTPRFSKSQPWLMQPVVSRGHILEKATNKIPCQLLDSEKTRLALWHIGILTSEHLLDDKIRSCL